MSDHESGQVAASAAEIYEAFFVPALFGDWPPRLLDAAGVRAGDHVLDVACGTGIVAREAARRVGADGAVIGLDVNDGMLAVARSRAPAIDWRQGAAESLPFDADSFDRVVCQFGLMFFEDKVRAISEMLRVAHPGGTVGVLVWSSLDETPGYAAVAGLLRELFGSDVARSIEVPFSLGNVETLRSLVIDAGAPNVSIETAPGKARFASIEAWLYTDIRGWTLADAIDDEAYERLRREAPKKLSRFEMQDGTVQFDAPAHLATVAV